jgi:hypothetical protein
MGGQRHGVVLAGRIYRGPAGTWNGAKHGPAVKAKAAAI